MVLFFLTDIRPSSRASLRGNILYQHCQHVPWVSLVSLAGDMSSRISREIKVLRRTMPITFGILSGFHFSLLTYYEEMGSIAPDLGRKDPKGKEKSPTSLGGKGTYTQKQTRKKIQKMPLKRCFVSLQLLILLQRSLKFSISWVCYRSSRVETQAFNEVYVNLGMFIFSKTDLGVLIKQQMRRRKELVQFSTTVIF